MIEDKDIKETNKKNIQEQLSFWVFDEELYVTSTYLLRNTDLDVEQVQKYILILYI